MSFLFVSLYFPAAHFGVKIKWRGCAGVLHRSLLLLNAPCNCFYLLMLFFYFSWYFFFIFSWYLLMWLGCADVLHLLLKCTWQSFFCWNCLISFLIPWFFFSYFLDFFYVTRTWRSHLLLRWTSQSVCRSGFFVTWKCSASFWYRCHCLIGFGLLINKIDNLMIKYRIASIRLWMRICWNAVYF